VEFALQGRAVFSVDFGDDGLVYRGFVVEPQARISKPGFFGEGTFATASIGPIFATEKLHDYFYEVESQFARAGRPAFDASAGYLGTEANVAAGFELTDRWSLFVGSELGIYAGAANRDSALFQDELNLSGFIGFSYTLFESERRVPRGR
ncbi:MAG: MipA/OmpV family protein, partial [Pseudomonadota bacterium]